MAKTQAQAKVPPCLVVTVHTFRGDRTRAFVQRIYQELDDEKSGHGPGPSRQDCLLFAGHTGLSLDENQVIYGFNPNGGADPTWLVLDNLRKNRAYPGIVLDDTAVFTAAAAQGLTVLRFDVRLPPRDFRAFERRLTAERKKSKYRYGFPNGDGDCNCTTWLERLALPLLSGSMDEFTNLQGFRIYPSRRFGICR